MNVKEREAYMIPEGTIAAICEAVRIEDMERFRKLDFSANEIYSSVGEVGIGTALPGEQPKNGRPILWSALKRAEIDLYRKLFPILSEFNHRGFVEQAPGATAKDWEEAIETAAPGQEAEVAAMNARVRQRMEGPGAMDAEYTEVGDPEPAGGSPPWPGEDDPAWTAGEDEEDENPLVLDPAFYGDDPAREIKVQLYAQASQYAARYAGGIHEEKATAPASPKQAQLVASMFTEAFDPDEDARKEYKSALRWLFEVDSATRLSFCQARAVLDWLIAGKDEETGAYILAQGAQRDARFVLRAAMLDAGQTEMFAAGEEE
jgi:hypothetical protein